MEYQKAIASIPDAWKHLHWHLDTYERIRNWALFMRKNNAYYRDVYTVLTQEINTDARVIFMVSECGKDGGKDA